MDNGFWAIPVMFAVIITCMFVYVYAGHVYRWFLYSGVVFKKNPPHTEFIKKQMKKSLDELTKL